MDHRLALESLLKETLGSENVYFQPPTNSKMQYPCIVYKRDFIKSQYADNAPYSLDTRYTLTYISRSPDDGMVDKLAALPKCTHQRFYTAENLNHDNFAIFF